MAIETLDLKQLDENSTDIYEAVVIASRRARQILNERNYERQLVLESLNEEDDDTTTEVMIQTSEEREQVVHPIEEALEELLDGKLNVEYEKEKLF